MTADTDRARLRLTAFASAGGIVWPDEPGVTLHEFGPCFAGTTIGLDVLGEYDAPAGLQYEYETLSEAVIAAGRDYWERHAALFEAACWRDYMDNAAFPSPEGEQLATLQGDIRAILAALATAEVERARLVAALYDEVRRPINTRGGAWTDDEIRFYLSAKWGLTTPPPGAAVCAACGGAGTVRSRYTLPGGRVIEQDEPCGDCQARPAPAPLTRQEE